MKRITITAGALAGMLAATPADSARADEVDAAYAVCQSIMNTGLGAECEVSGWDGAVDAWLDTNSAEARKICAGMVEAIAQQTDAFARASRTWRLRIMSPYSGDHPIATCDLR